MGFLFLKKFKCSAPPQYHYFEPTVAPEEDIYKEIRVKP